MQTDQTMQLSRHDLAQLDEAYLAGLPEGSQRVLSVKRRVNSYPLMRGDASGTQHGFPLRKPGNRPILALIRFPAISSF
jgi:hypothetical protein